MGGGIYISTDAGATWKDSGAPNAFWTTLACSADGYRVIAGDQSGALCALPYVGPWRITNAPGNVVAASANGATWVAAVSGGPIYISHDAGSSWLQTSAPSNDWVSVACSADATKLVAAAGSIYLSEDSGATWNQASAPSEYWGWSVASSADGTSLVAACGYGSDGSELLTRCRDLKDTWKMGEPDLARRGR